jgi:hypothetical protein
MLEDLTPGLELSAKTLDLAYQVSGLTRAKSTQEWQQRMHVLMVNNQVDVDSHIIHSLNIDFLKTISKLGLIDMLLHWIKIQCESLVLSNDWTPKI